MSRTNATKFKRSCCRCISILLNDDVEGSIREIWGSKSALSLIAYVLGQGELCCGSNQSTDDLRRHNWVGNDAKRALRAKTWKLSRYVSPTWRVARIIYLRRRAGWYRFFDEPITRGTFCRALIQRTALIARWLSRRPGGIALILSQAGWKPRLAARLGSFIGWRCTWTLIWTSWWIAWSVYLRA